MSFWSVLLLQGGYNSTLVTVGTCLLGVASGTIGTFLVLRKRALMGDALAHSALPGLALAFLIASGFGLEGKSYLLFGAVGSGLLGVLAVQFLTHYSRLQQDAAIGAVLSTFFGFGIVLMSIIQNMGTGGEGGLHHYIFGSTASMTSADAWLMLTAAVISSVFCVLLFKEFRLVCFDREFAETQGWSILQIELTMMFLVVVVTVVGMQAVGLLLIVALLVIPPAAARFWTENLGAMTLIAAGLGGGSAYLGAVLSSVFSELPAGSVIVLVAGATFALSFLFAPERGLFARMIAFCRMSVRVSADHLLREVYEICEVGNHENPGAWISVSSIRTMQGWSPIYRLFMLWRMSHQVEVRKNLLHLKPAGVEEAQSRVRNHRLWEEYLLTYASMPVSHVDYSADLVEHVLSNDIVERLKESLRQRDGIPESPHPLGGSS